MRPDESSVSQVPAFEPNERLLIEGDGFRQRARFASADAAVMKVFDWSTMRPKDIPWAGIRRISRREGRERRWEISGGLAVVGGGLLGACGYMLDALGKSTSGHDPTNPITGWAILVGAAIAGALGFVIVYALPAPYWKLVVEAPASGPPLTAKTLDERAAQTTLANADFVDSLQTRLVVVRTIAQAILVVLVLSICSRFSR